MAIGDEASVPSTQSASQITISPARASRPDFAERIFSLIVLPDTARSLRSFPGPRNPAGTDEVTDGVDEGAAHVEWTVDAGDERDAGGGARTEPDGVEHDQRRDERAAGDTGAGKRGHRRDEDNREELERGERHTIQVREKHRGDALVNRRAILVQGRPRGQ